MQSIKCVVVGDGGVGKTTLLVAYAQDDFRNEYVPTVFDNFNASVSIPDGNDKRVFNLALWDTAGQEEFHQLRHLAYPDTDVFLICFSVIHPPSLSNVTQIWVPELQQYSPSTPFIIVGLKNDLREDIKVKQYDEENMMIDIGDYHISKRDGIHVAKECGAAGYVECSALTRYNVDRVFEMGVRSAWKAKTGEVFRPPGEPSPRSTTTFRWKGKKKNKKHWQNHVHLSKNHHSLQHHHRNNNTHYNTYNNNNNTSSTINPVHRFGDQRRSNKMKIRKNNHPNYKYYYYYRQQQQQKQKKRNRTNGTSSINTGVRNRTSFNNNNNNGNNSVHHENNHKHTNDDNIDNNNNNNRCQTTTNCNFSFIRGHQENVSCLKINRCSIM